MAGTIGNGKSKKPTRATGYQTIPIKTARGSDLTFRHGCHQKLVAAITNGRAKNAAPTVKSIDAAYVRATHTQINPEAVVRGHLATTPAAMSPS